jgi:hypothetical protein
MPTKSANRPKNAASSLATALKAIDKAFWLRLAEGLAEARPGGR